MPGCRCGNRPTGSVVISGVSGEAGGEEDGVWVAERDEAGDAAPCCGTRRANPAECSRACRRAELTERISACTYRCVGGPTLTRHPVSDRRMLSGLQCTRGRAYSSARAAQMVGDAHAHLESHAVKPSADIEHSAKLPNAVGPYCQLCVHAHLGEGKEGQILAPHDCSSIHTLVPLLGRACAMGCALQWQTGRGHAPALSVYLVL